MKGSDASRGKDAALVEPCGTGTEGPSQDVASSPCPNLLLSCWFAQKPGRVLYSSKNCHPILIVSISSVPTESPPHFQFKCIAVFDRDAAGKPAAQPGLPFGRRELRKVENQAAKCSTVGFQMCCYSKAVCDSLCILTKIPIPPESFQIAFFLLSFP